jgi:site-specific recombinase XerD
MQLLGNINVQDLQPRDLQRYLLYCFRKGISENTIHSRINALKFYYEQVLHKEKMFFEIPRPKKPLQLPKVLSKEEIAAIIKAIKIRFSPLCITGLMFREFMGFSGILPE